MEDDKQDAPRGADRMSLDEYNPDDLPEHLRWSGDGPPPRYWWVGGTKVYRSYADYCDD